MVIFLYGTSSAGKSSLAKSLQALLAEPYLHIEVDAFLKMLPDGFVDKVGQEAAWQTVRQLLSGFHRSLPALASAGCNLLVDHVLQESVWVQECVTLLADEPVLFVGVHCSLEELERRELARGDRAVGTARFQIEKVHANCLYDVEVDTGILSSDECARKILACLKQPPKVSAFDRLREQGE